jgi:phenylalanyl-tRNA synthetase beta chain
MLISKKWLNEYVELTMPLDQVIDRLTMSGLNHDGTETVGSDVALNLEVTSNRADCLGHIGIAREVATLFDLRLRVPDPQPKTNGVAIQTVCQVAIENPSVCFRYTARLIKGVKLGPSPTWMQDRLQTLGIGIVNSIVDITNYVMFECGQPLHAFDFKKIGGSKIIVRKARAGEKLVAIDHREYSLTDDMCVIADASKPLALGGVMGGADSEVSEATTDVLIEAAYFEQLAIRNTARALNLHSPSSFRFERDVDAANLDWASRRCCQLILEIAGGELFDGSLDVGQSLSPTAPITLRYRQIERILGIEVPRSFVASTLEKLGLSIRSDTRDSIVATPPSWRKDLTREVDLIEEVGRIYGYDKVPDDAIVPLAASYRPAQDRVLDKVRNVLTATGFDEAVTASLVPQPWSDAFSPWTSSSPLKSSQPMLGVLEKASQNIGAVDLLRRSLIPSLLEVRRINEYRSNEQIELFETAKVYLPVEGQAIPSQPTKLGLVSERDYGAIKGVVESLLSYLSPDCRLRWKPCRFELLDRNRSGELWIKGLPETWICLGWLGEVSASGRKLFGLRTRASVCELDFSALADVACLVPKHQNQSLFPPVSRDFNFVMDDSVKWFDLEASVRDIVGGLLEQVHYRETFRDEKRDGAGKKRILLSIVLRSPSNTLTSQQVEEVSQKIIANVKSRHAAELCG